jgi:hypothetical protein
MLDQDFGVGRARCCMRHGRERLSLALLCVAWRAGKILRERSASTNYGRQNESRWSRRQGISVLS